MIQLLMYMLLCQILIESISDILLIKVGKELFAILSRPWKLKFIAIPMMKIS